jgi:predicted CopG family antitoxin
MKTITISDETYRRLESIKSGRSFSETIDSLISKSVGERIDHVLNLQSYMTGREVELDKIVRDIRKRTKARQVLETHP